MVPLLVRLPDARVGYVPAPTGAQCYACCYACCYAMQRACLHALQHQAPSRASPSIRIRPPCATTGQGNSAQAARALPPPCLAPNLGCMSPACMVWLRGLARLRSPRLALRARACPKAHASVGATRGRTLTLCGGVVVCAVLVCKLRVRTRGAVATLERPIQGIKNPDKKLSEFFKKMQRQKPHSKEHKLGVIVPFRDGCSAMSQACANPSAVPDLPLSCAFAVASVSADAVLTCVCMRGQGAGRRQNLMEFVGHMPAFLDLVGVSNFRVIVVEQTQFGHWNKGVLFNRGGCLPPTCLAMPCPLSAAIQLLSPPSLPPSSPA